MRLFKILETKLRNFYTKCDEQMPEQATVLSQIPGKVPARTAIPQTDQENVPHDQYDLEEIAQRDGTSEEMTPKITAAHDIQRAFTPQRLIKQNLIPKRFAPQKPTLQRATSQSKADHQRVLTRRRHERAIPRDIITKDPRKPSTPAEPAAITLEKAKELITDVLRVNSYKPDWDPELPRMVISASLHAD